MLHPQKAAQAIKSFALEVGFDLVGISKPQPSPYAAQYRQYLAQGKHGSMDYLARNTDQRFDPAQKFPWLKSILSVAIAYHQPTPELPPDAPTGKIARYAWGRDYHKVVESKLKILERKIKTYLAPGPHDETPPPSTAAPLEIRTYCDTGPLLERELAARAGLGWIGKNTLLIHPRHGSFFLLGEMLLSIDLEPDSPIADHCGTCTRCIAACPTDAITAYSLDATACISYHTLENRGTIEPAFHAAMQEAGFLIGCDICQDVCPFNRRPLQTTEPDFAPRPPAPAMNLAAILQWQDQNWDIQTRGRAFRRAKLPMWQRNAQILLTEKSE